VTTNVSFVVDGVDVDAEAEVDPVAGAGAAVNDFVAEDVVDDRHALKVKQRIDQS